MVVIEVILTLERFMESFHHLLSAGVLGLVAVWIASKGDVIVRRSGQTGQVGWENVASCDNEMTPPEDLDSMLEEDPTQLYLSVLFSPEAFLPSTLIKTLAIFRCSMDRGDLETLSWDRLRAEVVTAMENEVQQSLAEYEVTDEDYVLCQARLKLVSMSGDSSLWWL